MTRQFANSFNAKKSLTVGDKSYDYFSLKTLEEQGHVDLSKLPMSLKVLLENLLRNEDSQTVTDTDVKAMGEWIENKGSAKKEISYYPARVLMQDFTGVPAVVDLAAMRDAMVKLGGDAKKINPLAPVDLVIDHSVSVEHFATEEAFEKNVELEFQRNKERYEFLKWGQNAFENFRVVPPGTGICHQVNLEYLAQVAWTKTQEGGDDLVYCDTLVGTDSHTTMINGLAVLGWGVGGIEAEAAMLGQAVTMLIPEVIGFELTGSLKEGTTATDLVLTVVEMLRRKGVVGKFVEFYGEGLKNLSLADRATIANMAPEYGATCGFFPVDEKTIDYLRFTGRDEHRVQLAEAYAKEQGLWYDGKTDATYTDTLKLELGEVEPSIAGPKRPQDRIALAMASDAFYRTLNDTFNLGPNELEKECEVEGENFKLNHGHIGIAAITSCTNTSNPSVMLAAGLVARKALEKGLSVKPWVKTSLAPGSQVVTDYLEAAGLQNDLDALGFNLVGYGCTTCIGNSGPLPPAISKSTNDNDLVITSVLSGNRNFEGRIGPDLKANYLASPPLVVAYAIAGSMKVDITRDELGKDKDGNPVFLKDIWPSNSEIEEVVKNSVTNEMFKSRYADVFAGEEKWQAIETSTGETYNWNSESTYVQHPPYFEGMNKTVDKITDIVEARPLAILGQSVTTDHISPAGAIKPDSPAGKYLSDRNVKVFDFNSYGSRRGNHEVMMRGTFANIRIKNLMLDGVEGGYTKHIPSGEQMSIYDAAMKYQAENTPLVVVAGSQYGTGSSRDWAAKGTVLQGVRAVITESFERIHRSNLIGMGVLPLQFTNGQTASSLGLTGTEKFTITNIDESLKAQGTLDCTIERENGDKETVSLLVRIDTDTELDFYRNEGILHYVLRQLS